jgi:mRNA-degrading endonuclease HigB of HigAB toxin-antitoxin module
MATMMRILGKSNLHSFSSCDESQTAGAVAAWYAEVEAAAWNSAAELAARYPSAEFHGPDYVLFHLIDDGHCAIVRVNYGMQLVLIKSLGPRSDATWPPIGARAKRARS